MDAPGDLLKKAALCRRVASIKTTGSARADRVLLETAWRIERLAEKAAALGSRLEEPQNGD